MIRHLKKSTVFQFPSNGKAYPKSAAANGNILEIEFQFPSNGKAYPKFTWPLLGRGRARVSIPFKRESVSKVTYFDFQRASIWEFQFPSNGKAYPKRVGLRRNNNVKIVSIPFKRESVSKGEKKQLRSPLLSVFQFPSNGKAYPKLIALETPEEHTETFVSIPFKRESVSKETPF